MPNDPPVLEIPLWVFNSPWLHVYCGCGRSVSIGICDHRRFPWDQMMAPFLGRFRCKMCGGPPVRISLTDTGNAFATGEIGGRRIWLLR